MLNDRLKLGPSQSAALIPTSVRLKTHFPIKFEVQPFLSHFFHNMDIVKASSLHSVDEPIYTYASEDNKIVSYFISDKTN